MSRHNRYAAFDRLPRAEKERHWYGVLATPLSPAELRRSCRRAYGPDHPQASSPHPPARVSTYFTAEELL